MENVVITGATGMLGIALIKQLLKENIKILAIVNPHSHRVSNIPIHKNITIISCDLSDLDTLTDNITKSYDIFYHFAWEGTYGEQRNDTIIQLRNVKNTLKAIWLAHAIKCHTFIGAGSQAEYGRVNKKLTSNTPTFPESAYGIAKLCAGQISRIEAEKLGLKHIWLRFLSVYGPYDGEQTMIMSSIKKMIHKQDISYTKAEQIWDYLYCDDAAQACCFIAKKGKNKAVYCIGSGEGRPLKDYIQLIKHEIDPSLNIGIGKLGYSDKQVMYLCADITELRKDTGFEPKVKFEEGIKKTIDWYKEVLENEKNKYSHSLL